MSGYFLMIIFSALAALGFAVFLFRRVLSFPEGNQRMREIALAVREGAEAYLRRQFQVAGIFFISVFLILLFLSFRGYFHFYVPAAFLSGGLLSALAGFIGMSMATRASSRTAEACRKSLDAGLRLAFSAGAVMGFTVVGLGLLGMSLWFCVLLGIFSSSAGALPAADATGILLTFSMGASFQALFARVGGGIFTKAADVGADLVGKVEAGIPEDDARNPAVIADNVGDNVGDVAGMGADLYESYVGSIAATAALGVAAGLGIPGIVLPMLIAGAGIFSSMAGMTMIHTKENTSQKNLLKILRRGIIVSSILVVLLAFIAVNRVFGPSHSGFAFSVMIGIIAGVLIGILTECFTSSTYLPTQRIAEACQTGPATTVIEGFSVGMISVAAPVAVITTGVLLSFLMSGGFVNFGFGIYGVGLSAVGMLSTLGLVLATDAYGPIADNAGGNAQMAGLDPEIRKRTDALDALGNTTAATGKGFAIGSAALTAMALIAAFKDKILALNGVVNFDLLNPMVLGGLFIGATMPYIFSALTMQAVRHAASQIVVEVRRQFKEIPGIMQGTGRPDYARCVDIVTRSALREMVLPALLAVFAPIVTGLLLGVDAVGALLIGATICGSMLAIMMANAGGAWDNAKKYIEEGHFGGKGSEAHKAAVVGDTIGDPFKDTSGPSINILIKLMSMVSIVFAVFMVKFHLFHF